MRFAAIDIGSNAIRLLLCNVYEKDGQAIFKKSELVRVPVRLGDDAFLHKRITDHKILQLCKTMSAFRDLIEVFGAISYKACATSAMREAENGDEIITYIKRNTGIQIEIIDGKTEAQIIYSNHIAESLEKGLSYLYIDVGGGSTELTLFSDGEILASHSFNVGTIRFLHENVKRETWNDFKNWVKTNTAAYRPLVAIGSGGNINKLVKMSGRKDSKSMSYEKLKELREHLEQYTVEERITQLNLNPDRADVIVPAAKIFLSVMKNANINEILVPQVGLSDGIIHLLYEQHRGWPEVGR